MAKSRTPQTVAIYCPLWHSYDHMNSWKGEGWCEWELLKNAIPRFPGHHQPLQPSWGCFDESDPKWSEKEINLAADHGLDVFLFDWYWFSGVKLMEEALEHGFLKAPSRKRMKFAIMWANHDWTNYFRLLAVLCGVEPGDSVPRPPWDFSLWDLTAERENEAASPDGPGWLACRTGPETALGLRPRRALSSAQVP